ncbi:hypothetical protein LTR62_005224 [Meristemomyces frigidus]|uniref:Uncharacterized protein n=1 Tax=Meristemomyces frigidus TaxID=1508187 RepID=A0AAN7YJK3_9PEZI|nr:hypothetical protein LTR62_005224 [Meristemomyces frigidus]
MRLNTRPEGEGHEKHLFTPATTPLAPQSSDPESTVQDLERISRAFVDVLNAHDFDFTSLRAQEVRSRMSPDWRTRIDTVGDPQPCDFEEQQRRWKSRALDNPDVHFKVVEVMSKVVERKQRARVFMEMEVSGVTSGKVMAMNELRWKKVDGVWLCYYTIGMRGGGVNNAAALGSFDLDS